MKEAAARCVWGESSAATQTPCNLLPFLSFLHQHYLLKILTKDKEANVYFMNVRLWFIFLCGVCVYNLNRLSQRKVLFLFLSPDVNDKVSCGSAALFDMHFKRDGEKKKQQTSHPCRLICNGYLLLLFLLLLRASESKTVEGVKRVTSLFCCNDLRKLEVCCVWFLRQFDLVGVQARPLSSLTHALLKPWARIRHSEVITCQKELI